MSGDSPPPRLKTVLVVEDNQLNQKLLNDLLEYQGYTVAAPPLGEQALELARQYTPDLILMDLQLPDISGMEATARLMKRRYLRVAAMPTSLSPLMWRNFLGWWRTGRAKR